MFGTYEMDIIYSCDNTEYENSATMKGSMSLSDAFLFCRNKFHTVELDRIAFYSGKTTEEVVNELAGKAIFQDPEHFAHQFHYEIDKGWVFREQYLSGFLPDKLKTAEQMNRRFPHCFDINIKTLKRLASETEDPDHLVITLGSPFIPCDIYADFIWFLLRLKQKPTVKFNIIRSIFEIKVNNKDDMNTIRCHKIYSTLRMNALDIIRKTMNASALKIYDVSTDYYGKTNRIFNPQETIYVQEIQKKIITAFINYVEASEVRLNRIREAFKKRFRGFYNEPYDGSYLDLPNLNPNVKLYQRQKNIIARGLESEHNTIIIDPTGSGKSYPLICIAHELYRTRQSTSNLFVVPNSTLPGIEQFHHYLYHQDKILVVTPKDFVPTVRNQTLKKIRDGDYVAVYMTHDSFNMLKMSKRHKRQMMEKEIDRLRAAAASTSTAVEQHSYRRMADSKSKELFQFIEEYKDPEWLCYDDLGIQTLIVDEAHTYKNISIKTHAQGIVGMRAKGSAASDEMLLKVHHTKKVLFSTGTPLTNSLCDLYTMMLYLQPEQLRFRNIQSFDMWINTFGERVSEYELDIAHKLRIVTRFASFHNLSELMSMFGLVCDFCDRTPPVPVEATYENIKVPITLKQKEYIRELGNRYDRIRRREVSRTEDNALKITIDGRKCSLEDGDKIEYCAQKIEEIYRRFPGKAQVVFSDIGTPKSGSNIYDSLRSLLVRKGVPRNEIAFVHDAKNERQRKKLFEQINAGAIRVVIGSTPKLGVGVNIQTNLIAMHHLSVPWRPSDFKQREGRILRQGNLCKHVYIFRYITEGTFDAYLWQLLESKQRFIASFLSGVATDSKVDDIADTVLTYAEIKALAIGNPLIRERVEKANELDHLRISSHKRKRELVELQKLVENLPLKIARQKTLIMNTEIDAAYYEGHRERIANDERIAFGEELIQALKQNVEKSYPRAFDKYQGFVVELPEHMTANRPFVNLVSRGGRRYYVAIDYNKPMGCAQRLDILLDRLPQRAEEQRTHLSQMRRQLKDARADLANGNPYLEQIDILENELKQIDQLLEESEVA